MQLMFDFLTRLDTASEIKTQIVSLNPKLKYQRPCTTSQYTYIQSLCAQQKIEPPERWQLTRGEAGLFIRKLIDLDFENFQIKNAN